MNGPIGGAAISDVLWINPGAAPTGGINPLSGLIHSGDMGMMPAKNLIVVKALSVLLILLAM